MAVKKGSDCFLKITHLSERGLGEAVLEGKRVFVSGTVPGDQIQFEDLTLQFIVDENLENFLEIHSWIYGLGYPDSVSQFESIVIDRETSEIDNLKQFSDGTLTVLNSNFNPMAYIKFKDMFPVSLSTLEFTASENDYTYFTATVTFKYLLYEILDTKFKVRTTSLTKP